ncbi:MULTISPECIES: ABC transporter permease [unclassified Streptomyces]|uniref:ABC transporter permease n=1 Tax=unclassified Streptomyces TaxID=2593676 RepID=UPI0032504B93
MNGALVDTLWLTHRRLSVVVRQPGYLAITMVQPVIWLFLFGSLFKRIVELPGFGVTSYLDYLVPGIVVMNALSFNSWAGMGTLDEIERGTLNRFLITPVRRSAMVSCVVVEHGLSTVVQSLIIVLLGRAGGAHYAGGVPGVVVLITAAVLLGMVFSALSHTIGLLVRRRETVIALNTFLLLPLTFLSSAFMSAQLMPHWMRAIAGFNPVNWALVAGRSALGATPDWITVLTRCGGLAALAVLLVAVSLRGFSAYQRSV